jgi:phospholipid/cholesterol/gamma-HCH transport system substrate-binding protein
MYDHVKHLRWAGLKVGILITIALIVLVLAVLFAGSLEGLFTSRVEVYAVFDDVKGLRKGAPVWFAGIEVGSVKSLQFMPQQRIRATISLDPDVLKYLKKDSRATILTFGLLGDKYMEIDPGSKGAEPLEPGDTIQGTSQIEIGEVVETGKESIERLSEFIKTLDEIIRKIEKGEGTVARFIRDPSVYENLKETTGELARLLQRLEAGEGTLGRLMRDETIYQDISSSVKDISAFAESLKTSEGTLNKVIKDPALYERFLRASESLEEFTDRLARSRGTLGRLIEDESLYENINSVSERLAVLLERVEKGEGVMGSLIRDEELSTELKTTLKELNALIKDMRDNPRRYFKFSLF